MNLNVYQFDAKFMDWNESIPDTREITNANDQSNPFWYMKLKVQFISVFIYVRVQCAKWIWHFVAKKMSENLPEIYITINKWRKSNFTLSLAPIPSFSSWTSRTVIEFREYWCLFALRRWHPEHCVSCLCLYKSQKNL